MVFFPIFMACAFLSTTCSGNELSCHETSASEDPVCFPSDYSKMRVPTVAPPLKVELEFSIIEISRIDDHERTMTIHLYFTVRWPDPRFQKKKKKRKEVRTLRNCV